MQAASSLGAFAVVFGAGSAHAYRWGWGDHSGPQNPCSEEEAASRSFSGRCNNLGHPEWGEAGRFFEGERNFWDGASEVNPHLPLSRAVDLEVLAPGGDVDPFCDNTLLNCSEYDTVVPNVNKGVADENVLSETLNAFVQGFGQFLGHDVADTKEDGFCERRSAFEFLPERRIALPSYDKWLWHTFSNPRTGTPGTLKGVPPVMAFNPTQGDYDEHGVLRTFNFASSYADLSVVYGNEEERAAALREDFSTGTGHMILKTQNVTDLAALSGLPFMDTRIATGTITMPNFLPVLRDVNFTATPCVQALTGEHWRDILLACGDDRCGENIVLLSFHFLYVYEHNRIADLLKANHPDWTGEQLFNEARRVNIGQYQGHVKEYLRLLTGDDPRYTYEGYDDEEDATLDQIFSFALRQHTVLVDTIPILDECNEGIGGFDPPPYVTTFTRPRHSFLFGGASFVTNFDDLHLVPWAGGKLSNAIRGILTQPAGELSDHIIPDAVRIQIPVNNFTGVSVPARNIRRGRVDGLISYNQARKRYLGRRIERERGCRCVDFDFSEWRCVKHNLRCFEYISSDQAMAQKLQDLYGNVDYVDYWIGMLVEDRAETGSMGRVAKEVLIHGLRRLMHGDRFWFENSDYFTEAETEHFRSNTLSVLFKANFAVDEPDLAARIPPNLFYLAPEYQDIPPSCARR